ncbi:hypothetical protein CCH79_00013108, partial [Gambusia affinis]
MWARAVLCAALLSVLCPAGSTEAERDEREVQDYSNSNRLLGALHEVLEKLQTKRINPWEKKYGQVPSCDLGEHCAIRKGSRIGKMCDCPRGAFCNFFLLKRLDSSGLLEVHADRWLGDLQVGEAAEVLQEDREKTWTEPTKIQEKTRVETYQQLQHLLGVGVNLDELLVQSRHLH